MLVIRLDFRDFWEAFDSQKVPEAGCAMKPTWCITDFQPFLLPGNMTPLLEAELLPERKGLPAFSGHVHMSHEQCCSAGLCHLEGNPAS